MKSDKRGTIRSALLENKANGALSLTRVMMVAWLGLLMVSFFVVLAMIVFSPVITMNGEEVFRHQWPQYAGAFQFGAVTFGGLITQYLVKKGIERVKNGG